MDLSPFWQGFLTGSSVSAACFTLLLYVLMTWLKTRMQESVRHEYSKKLAEHAAKLQKQQREENGRIEADKALFTKLLCVLPTSGGSIEFVCTFDMAGHSFDIARLKELDTFCHEWGTPERQFLDAELDLKRKRLCEAVTEYLQYLALNTFPRDTKACYSCVPPEWQQEDPDRFNETVGKLHSLGDEVVRAHQDLVEAARRELKC